MKRILAIALALLLCGAALAEADLAFAGGVSWGMTRDEVLAAKRVREYEMEPFGTAGAQVLDIDDDQRYQGAEYDLDYLLAGGSLVAAKCEFDAEDIAASTLAAALDAQYGARGAGDTGAFCDLMSALAGMDYALKASARAGDFFYDWTAADGTYAVLTNRLSDDGDDIDLFFFDAPSIGGGFSLSEPAPALNPEG